MLMVESENWRTNKIRSEEDKQEMLLLPRPPPIEKGLLPPPPPPLLLLPKQCRCVICAVVMNGPLFQETVVQPVNGIVAIAV